MRYDAFGNLLQIRGDVLRLPIGFAGGLFDADTGLTRFVWRDYDADTGSFTALDPLGEKGGDKDWYGYCVDDPVNRVDVWGLWWGEETPGGRIVWSGLKTAGEWGAKGGVGGLAIEGVGAVPGAAAGALLGFPYGLLKGTVTEISTGGGDKKSEAEKQSESGQEQREILD